MRLNNIVMFVCNEGGHYSQMMSLGSLFRKFPSVLITDNLRLNKNTYPIIDLKNIEFALGISNKRKQLAETNKKLTRLSYFTGYVALFFQSFKLWFKYRPKIIISTGSNIAVPFFILGHMLGSKTVYIESRAKVKSKNFSGKLVAPFCDKIFVQWPEMLKLYGHKAEYHGILY